MTVRMKEGETLALEAAVDAVEGAGLDLDRVELHRLEPAGAAWLARTPGFT